MQLQQASRKKAKIKMALQGPSGSGKTKSALLIAHGLCGSWEKIAVIDTENRSADLYADLGNYNVLPLQAPFTPEKFIEAIQVCQKAEMEVVIIDSSSHEWDNLLEYHASLTGNSFTNWSKVTPRHDAFVNAILQANTHIISTIRSKQEYVLSEKNGKQVPEKVGMKGIQRDNLEYEFTVVLELDMALRAKASKDRTGLFIGKPEFIPTIETGGQILYWCEEGIEEKEITTMEDVIENINTCKTTQGLSELYHAHPKYQQVLGKQFTQRKHQLLNTQKFSQNGTHSR